jgi:cysteinyl-tRNA synthetase
MDFVLGLDLDRAVPAAPPAGARPGATLESEPLPESLRELVTARTTARAGRDWATADRLRDELHALGVEVIDLPDGTSETRPIA